MSRYLLTTGWQIMQVFLGFHIPHCPMTTLQATQQRIQQVEDTRGPLGRSPSLLINSTLHIRMLKLRQLGTWIDPKPKVGVNLQI